MPDDHAPTTPESSDDDRFRPGERIGRYVLLSLAGRGGMSVVYLAYDPELDRKVALKLMRLGQLGTLGKQRLVREAQALAKLSHPNVIPVFDVGTVGDQAWVAMEYVEGQTLKRWLKTPRSWREVLATLREAGRGLAAAHAAGFVHRDFKPENVLIGIDGRARVVDFGLARPVEELTTGSGSGSDPNRERRTSSSEITRADQVVGTPAYMAPEQVHDGATDARADQFSFCVTLYEALWRVKPHDATETLDNDAHPTIAEKTNHRKRKIAADPPKDSGVPRWIERAVMRGLSLDPVDRWPSMDALLVELGRDPADRWRRWAIAGVAIGMLAAGVIVTARAAREQRELCAGGRARVASVWSPSVAESVRKAFAATGLPFADAAAQSFTRSLDQQAAGWAAMHDDACAATRLRGEQSEEVLDLRMMCLDDRLKELGALSQLMQHADADAVREAPRAGRSLSPLGDCADLPALKTEVPPPKGEARARVEALRGKLAAMQAEKAVGKNGDVVKLGETLKAEARALGYAPLAADVELLLAHAYADLGDDAHSIPTFSGAFSEALAGRHDRALAEAAARLAQEYIYKNDMNEYRRWDAIAEAAVARIGDQRIGNFVEHTRCVSLWQSGAMGARMDCLRKHAERMERAGQPLTEWELTTLGLAASDAGQVQEALAWLERGAEYSAKQNGATHPRTLEMRGYVCKGYIDYGDLEHARRECQDALAKAKEVAADNHYVVGKIELYLGATLRELGDYRAARPLLEDAAKTVTPTGEALVELAQIAGATGDHAGALAYFQKSLSEDEKTLSPDHPNLVTDLWLLGTARLQHGEVTAALDLLERARRICEHADLSPLLVADVRFDYARALAQARPQEKAQADAIAREVRATLATQAPKTQRFAGKLARADAWLAR